MPNWCDNDLYIYGSEEDLKKIKEQVTNEAGEFDFGKIIPEPDTPDYFTDNLSWEDREKHPLNWYEWRIENWGTKWNASESVITEVVKNETLQAWFQTAWAPALPITIALSKQYPNVTIEHKFIEEGMDFCGVLEIKNGEELAGTWDGSPNHTNIELLGRECQCEWDEDQENWYQDCPKEEVLVNG
jgi:hypothetical protein